MKNILKYILILSLLVLIGIGIYTLRPGQSPQSSINKKIQVNTSFYPLYFFATQIGGDKANVRNITPAGAEPHDYEPSAKDIASIEKGDLLILNGGVESWGNKIKDNLKNTKVTIVTAGEELLTKELSENGKKMKDPHIWLDPVLAKKEVEKIKKGYETVDPTNSAYYDANTKNLEDKLQGLDTTYKEGLKNCRQKNIVTSHAAFAYLAERYGLNQVAISGLSPDEEPSTQQLAQVAEYARKNNVKYIFFESLVSPKLAETIAQEIGAKTMVLDPIEGLSDYDIKQGKNYFTVMEDNLKNLQVALECKK